MSRDPALKNLPPQSQHSTPQGIHPTEGASNISDKKKDPNLENSEQPKPKEKTSPEDPTVSDGKQTKETPLLLNGSGFFFNGRRLECMENHLPG